VIFIIFALNKFSRCRCGSLLVDYHLSSRLRVVSNFGDGDCGCTKHTRGREISRRRDATRLLELSRARVYFARPTIAIAKIRDYSQSIYQGISEIRSEISFGKNAHQLKTDAFRRTSHFDRGEWHGHKRLGTGVKNGALSFCVESRLFRWEIK